MALPAFAMSKVTTTLGFCSCFPSLIVETLRQVLYVYKNGAYIPETL